MNLTVSVIIPCYRQAQFLGEAIRSVLEQTHPAIEIIVVNDGSDDNTEEIARSFGTKVRYLKKSNGGLSSARNAGLRLASGDYTHFLDADDLIPRHAIATLVRAVGARGGIAIGGHRTFSAASPEDGHPPIFPTAARLFPALIYWNVAPVHCWLVPRKAISAAGGFDESLTSLEDWHLWIRLALRDPSVNLVHDVVAYYRRYTGSMSTNQDRFLEMALRVSQEEIRWLDEWPPFRERYGRDVLAATRGFIQKCLLNGIWEAEAARIYLDLQKACRGRRYGESWLGWGMRETTGFRGEKMRLALLKRFRPEVVARIDRIAV